MKRFTILLLGVVLCSTVMSKPMGEMSFPSKQGGAPVVQKKTHDVGNLHLTVSNYGYFGTGDDWNYVSCQYPRYSNTEYLYWGGLWIGAIVPREDTSVIVDTTVSPPETLVVDSDTFVSVGVEGWAQWQYEMYASADQGDTIYQLSTTGGKLGDSVVIYKGEELRATAEQEFLCQYSDTWENPAYVGPSHHPLGVEITQRSYAWSYEYAEDFVIFDFWIKNVGDQPLKDVYMGLYIDGDCGLTGDACSYYKAQDDVTGFREWRDTVETSNPKDQIQVAWLGDATGLQLYGSGSCLDWPAPGVTGTRVLRTPNPDLEVSFNWWISDSDKSRDWGPFDPSNPNDALFRELYEAQHGDTAPGTPDTDREKYLLMSNNLFDPDQIQEPPADRRHEPWDDTRYLLSFGPVYPEGAAEPVIQPGETVPITIAYIGGENFHRILGERPRGGEAHTSEEYYNFRDLAFNAYQVLDVYDNPGIDTDGDGYSGEPIIDPASGDTIDWTGDGVPDFGGYRPPNPPRYKVVAEDQKVTIYWDDGPEQGTVDNFPPFFPDFEGYRLYKSYAIATQEIGGYTLLGQWDLPYHMDDTLGFPRARLDTMHDTTGFNLWPPPANPDTANYPDYNYCWVDSPVLNYYERRYVVTTIDFGNPDRVVKAPPLQSGTYADTAVSPAPPAVNFTGLSEKVLVVPNPYRIDPNDLVRPEYSRDYWEDTDRTGWNEHKRRIDFIHLPENCIIRVYTLGGDLVKTIEHPGPETTSQSSASWRLISRDVQAVVSGIYLFSVEEPASGNVQVGKFVVIK